MSCSYRYINSCCKCLNNHIINNDYCKKHINYANNLYNIINYVFDDVVIINSNNIYKLFVYIYNNNEIYTKELVFKSCLSLLINKKKILLYIYLYYNINKNLNINKIINYIFNINYNTYKLLNNNNNNNNNNNKFNIIKNFIYKILLKNYTINEISINKEDPFTFDLIQNIPKNEVFKYKDNHNQIYAFNVLELKKFINCSGKWNPYTKELIPDNIIIKIDNFIKYNKLDINKIENKYKAITISQAYTEVSQLIEKIGFYNDVKWFLKFNITTINLIIKTFNYISYNIPEHKNFFNNIKNEFEFCDDIIKLFKDGNSRFLLCCLFIKSLALHSDDFFNNMPEWLVDVTNNNVRVIYNGNLFYLLHLLDGI